MLRSRPPASRRLLVAGLLGLPLLAGVVVTGCGSGGGEGASGPTTTAGAPDPPGGAGDDASGDTLPTVGVAGGWVVEPGDLPEGWGGLQLDTEAASDPGACALDAGDPEVVVDRLSAAYDGPEGAELDLGSTGLVVADAAIASDLSTRVLEGDVAACFEERLAETFEEDAGLEIRDLRSGYGPIPEGVQTTLSYEVVVNGVPQAIHQEQVVIVAGDRVALLTFGSGSEPFPADLRSSLLATVAQRIAAG